MNAMIDAKRVSWVPTLGPLMSASGAQTLLPASSPNLLEKREDDAPIPVVPVWNELQTLALVSLARAVDESSVFAAVIGPKGSGTSAVLARLLLISKQKKRISITISSPHKVSAKTVGELDDTITKAIGSLSGRSVHILFGIDNAHSASDDLLGLLNRLARFRECLGAPQVVLAGEPELWDRLSVPRYESLRRRFALRCSLENQLH